jgi:hypothetical protein
MKKFIFFLTTIVFFAVSFVSVSHFHVDSEDGSKTECPLCIFAHTIPVVPAAHVLDVFSVILDEPVLFQTSIAIISPLSTYPNPRGPPPVFFNV